MKKKLSSFSNRNWGNAWELTLWLEAYFQIWPVFKLKPVYLKANSSSPWGKSLRSGRSQDYCVEPISRGSDTIVGMILNICFGLIVALVGFTCDDAERGRDLRLVCEWAQSHLAKRRCDRREALLRNTAEQPDCWIPQITQLHILLDQYEMTDFWTVSVFYVVFQMYKTFYVLITNHWQMDSSV